MRGICKLTVGIWMLLVVGTLHGQVKTDVHGFKLRSTWEQVGPGLTKLNDDDVADSLKRFPELENRFKAQDEVFKTDAASIAAGEEASVSVPINEASYTFEFYSKRLVGVSARFNADMMPFEKLLAQATAKYGAKPRIERKVMQNGFGATWVVRNTAWTNPDDCVVKVEEGIKDGTRFTYLFVYTADEQ